MKKPNGVLSPWLTETPATWIDCNIRPRRTSHLITNVGACQHSSSLEQLIYIKASVQRQNIWKQICSLVHQLYRRIGNKRALKENEDQYKENCFAARKTRQCKKWIHGLTQRWDSPSSGKVLLSSILHWSQNFIDGGSLVTIWFNFSC